MSDTFVPWVDPHSVEVESETIRVWAWECSTCGKREDGYTLLSDAERSADDHATNSPRPDAA